MVCFPVVVSVFAFLGLIGAWAEKEKPWEKKLRDKEQER